MTPAGLPHSEISGSTAVCASPKLIAACHVLLRFPEPRHPPYALSCLTSISGFPQTRTAKKATACGGLHPRAPSGRSLPPKAGLPALKKRAPPPRQACSRKPSATAIAAVLRKTCPPRIAGPLLHPPPSH